MPRERPRQLLADGNYIRLAKSAVDPKYQGIGAVLVGNHREGLAKLGRAIPDLEVDYYKAFANWCLRDAAAANALLTETDAQHARLKSIINRKVRVLCQARHDGDKAWCISSTLKKNPEFDVVTIGNMAMDDIQLGVNDTIESVLDRLGDWRPDFYFIHMIEYRIIPLGIERAPFPVIFQSSDHRADYQQVMPALDLCDGMMVLGEQAHRELSRATKARVFTYPKLFGIHFEKAVTAASSEKNFDLFWSGNLLDESLYDKSTFFSHMTDALADSRKLALCNGKTSLDEYYNLMSQARVVPSYIHREQDSFSSRALEAITMGAITLVPAGNAIGLYFDESSGLVEFHPSNAVAAIQNVLDNWDSYYARSALQGRLRALAEFNFPDVVDQLFKGLLRESLNMPLAARQTLPHYRSIYRLYSRIESTEVYADPTVIFEYKAQCLARLKDEVEAVSDIDLTSAGAHMAWTLKEREIAAALLEKIYENNPTHIGVMFNLGYAYFYSGKTHLAARVFQALTKLSPSEARTSPLFALFDSSSQIYLTHIMRDELCNHFFGGAPIDSPLAYIKSVAHNFLAEIAREAGDMRGAIEAYRLCAACFPDNFIGQVNYGRFLVDISTNDADLRKEGCEALLNAIETYRGYLLTNVFEDLLSTNEDIPRREALCAARDRLNALTSAGQRLHTQGTNAWLALFGSESKSKEGIRQLRGAMPQLIEEGYHGFNIVRFGTDVFAFAQSAGPIDLCRMTSEEIAALKKQGQCLLAKGAREIKQMIVERTPVLHIEQQLTVLRACLESGDYASANRSVSILQDYANQDGVLANRLSPLFEEMVRRLAD